MVSPLQKLPRPSTWSLKTRLVLGVVILAGLGFAISDFVAQSVFRNYLVAQVDNQLNDIAGGSLLRLDRAGIAPQKHEDDDNEHPFRSVQPLTGVPTAVSITLLDATGNVTGTLGGDLATQKITEAISGITVADVIKHDAQPYTINGGLGNSDYRVLTRVLPSGFGSVVAAVSLDSVDANIQRLRSLFLLVGFVVLLLIALVSRRIISISLKPLTDVESTAEAIAVGDLSARMPDAKPDTEVGRLVTSLNRMLTRIEESFAVRVESENKLRRFVADASHELRTPLTAIRGFSELYRQGAVQGEEKTKELVGRIEKESLRMSSLVEDLLLLARIDQARELQHDPVDLNTLLKEVVASAEVSGRQHPISLSLPQDDVFVIGDSKRIHQVVANVVSNAQTHTPVGTHISISLVQNNDGTSIVVEDNGQGLSEADQARIFERFYRADPSRVRNGVEGSGLGLSIVDAVMSAHGGKVTVQSELGKGSTFTLWFPKKEEL